MEIAIRGARASKEDRYILENRVKIASEVQANIENQYLTRGGIERLPQESIADMKGRCTVNLMKIRSTI